MIKFFEVRDRATLMTVMAISTEPDNLNSQEKFILNRAGYYRCDRIIHLIDLNTKKCSDTEYAWGNARTMEVAHTYIRENYLTLESDQVVDVEYILGETSEPKVSERIERDEYIKAMGEIIESFKGGE